MSEENQRKNLIRQVHTGLYGIKSANMLMALKTYVERGGTKKDSQSFKASEIARAADNEIILNVFDDDHWDHPIRKTVFAGSNSGNASKDDAAVRSWLAGIVKGATKLRLLGHNYASDLHRDGIALNKDWRRDCATQVTFEPRFKQPSDPVDVTFTVAQAYAVYELLKGRKVRDKSFAPGLLKEMKGEPFDPVRTEIENFRTEEMKRIDAEYEAEYKEASKWFETEYDRICSGRASRRAAARQKAIAEKARVNAEINASLEAAFPSENSSPVAGVQSEAA